MTDPTPANPADSQPTSTDAAPPPPRPSLRRGLAMRLGLQGKLILAFMFILSIALGSTCWVFVSQSNRQLEDIMGEQARQISYALALASKPSLEARESAELRQMGQDLLKSRNILFVAFTDQNGNPITM